MNKARINDAYRTVGKVAPDLQNVKLYLTEKRRNFAASAGESSGLILGSAAIRTAESIERL